MFNNNGLSMDQAPPVKVVLRFLLTGSLFGIVGSLMLLFFAKDVGDYSSTQALATTHIFTLGVLASFMFGALFQMLPVLCGVSIKVPELLSMRINWALIFGTILLIASFFTNYATLYLLASALLAFATFGTALAMLKRLVKIEHSNSSRGMMLALFSLALTAFLGLLLIAIRSGFNINIDYLAIKSIHFNFGLFTWVALLIISVSFQVIEMFYVTPPYPQKYAKLMPKILIALLILTAIIALFAPNSLFLVELATSVLLALHAILTLQRLKQKKRAVTDATILFWALGMGSLIAFCATLILNTFFNIPTLLIATLYLFFALSILFAMAYKIVPFLVWFHLNAQGYFDAPMMHEVAHPKYAKANLYLFTAALVLLIFNSQTLIFQIGAFLLTISFFMLSLMIYRAWQKYLYVLENGKKFEFNFPK